MSGGAASFYMSLHSGMGARYARHIEPAKFWKRENSGSMVERERLVPVGGGNALHGRW